MYNCNTAVKKFNFPAFFMRKTGKFETPALGEALKKAELRD